MSEPNPSHSRTSSVASVLMLTRWFLRTQLWVWPLVAALVLVFIGVWLRVKMEGATKQQIADMLQTILNANNEALHSWSVTMKTDAENLAEDDRVRELVAGLIHSLILFVALVVVLQVDKQLGKGQPAIRTPSRDAGFTQRDRGTETLRQSCKI